MLKFIKHHMETISGVEIYPIVSFLIFFLFFLGMLWYVVKMRKTHVEKMGNLPLSDSPEDIMNPRKNRKP
jgi:cytochrome c oxidase cbb3-type subunit IV